MSSTRMAALLALTALSGCGGSTKTVTETTPKAAAQTTTEATTTEAATTEAAAPAEAPSQAGGLTAMGTTLKLGQAAVIAYDDSSNHKKSRIEVTPQKIAKGTIGDFKNIDLDAGQKASTPYYVTMLVKNVGKGDLSGTDPASYIDGVDDRGQEQNEIIFFGDFDRCNSDKAKSLKPGESYTSCLAYLIAGGGAIKGMRWIAFDEKSSKSNIDWK
jgi:hypothetical protein